MRLLGGCKRQVKNRGTGNVSSSSGLCRLNWTGRQPKKECWGLEAQSRILMGSEWTH
jgi:hypothetical protein